MSTNPPKDVVEVASHDLFADYVPGGECCCAAYGECECGCGADWTPKVEKLVRAWRDMPAAEMRLRCGELTAQEIRTVRAVLNQIIPANAEVRHGAKDADLD
jgi:hypothetical protein